MNSSKLSYRAEIDGLRAIALISVILYHAQMVLFNRDWFEGGYIGVDIFFVISGYLITRIILSELQNTGSFSFLNFYERRARRILPMLFVVIFASMPYAWNYLLPTDLVEYAESLLASLFFGSNFFFYFSTTEYGADSALLKPFLHTWSLSVEEQFYLIFPVIAIVAFKYFRAHFLTIIVALSLISLQFAELMDARNSSLNFYLPFSRFWELAVGSILAYRELNYKPSDAGIFNRVLPTFGIYLIAYSILFFDGNTPHPSFDTIIPILGVALIIVFASKDELVGKLLGSKPFVWVGLISYSAYLWHFPIFAFSRLGGGDHTNFDKLEWIAITIVLSVMSYFIIERPFRSKISFKWLLLTLSTSLFIVILFSYYVVSSGGGANASRLGFNISIIDSAKRPSEFFDKNGDDTCIGGSVKVDEENWCALGSKNLSGFEFVLLGDSHSMSSTATLHKVAAEAGLKGLYFGTSGCPPLIDVYAVRGNPHPSLQSKNCQNHVEAALRLAKKGLIKSVILIARWDYYVDGSDSGSWNKITDKSMELQDKKAVRDIYQRAVKSTYQQFSDAGVELVVLLQVPHQNTNPKRIFEDLLTQGESVDVEGFLSQSTESFLSLEDHKKRQKIANQPWIDILKGGYDSLTLIDPADVFCSDGLCQIYDAETSFYFDDDHASTVGFERLHVLFRNALVD